MPLTETESAEISAANDSGRVPVVFVHGLWLLPSSWDRWRRMFEDAGFATLAPGWPGDWATVEEARADPDSIAGKMVQEVTDHHAEVIRALDQSPVVIGHSFGGLIAQKLAGEGLAAVTVAIDAAQFQGVLNLPLDSLRSAAAVLRRLDLHRHGISLTWDQFRFGWVEGLPEEEGRALFEEYHVPASGVPILQAATANFNPFTETKVDTARHDRGPLLLIAGAADRTVPQSVIEAEYRIQQRNPDDTELVVIPDRGHSLTIDSGWKTVADTALEFVQRYL